MEPNTGIGWLGLIVGVILSMGLGFIWYNPKSPTGKAWAEGTGVGLEPPDEFPALAMGINTLGLVLIAFLVASAGAMPAYMGALAFGVMNISGNLFAGKPITVGLVHLGYWLGAVTLMVLAQSIL